VFFIPPIGRSPKFAHDRDPAVSGTSKFCKGAARFSWFFRRRRIKIRFTNSPSRSITAGSSHSESSPRQFMQNLTFRTKNGRRNVRKSSKTGNPRPIEFRLRRLRETEINGRSKKCRASSALKFHIDEVLESSAHRIGSAKSSVRGTKLEMCAKRKRSANSKLRELSHLKGILADRNVFPMRLHDRHGTPPVTPWGNPMGCPTLKNRSTREFWIIPSAQLDPVRRISQSIYSAGKRELV
jgi:hypothetical protein